MTDREVFMKALDKYYSSKKDKKEILAEVEAHLNLYDLLEKKEELKKAIREYLKVSYRLKEVPDEIINVMVCRVDEPVNCAGIWWYE